MMNKVKRKFIGFSMAAIFVLLTVLLGIINVIDFTLASQDADRLTQIIAEGRGLFVDNRFDSDRIKPDGMRGPMGPTSPEMPDSLRYFTFAFGSDGSVQTVSFHLTAMTEEDARQWAASLRQENTGWTRLSYRYRTYERDGATYVTVIDQGRELISAYRILIISAVGEAVFLLISFGVLIVLSGKLLDPIEKADRRQKQFIAEVEHNFKVPLTVLNAGTELLERQHGATEVSRSMRGQLRKLNALVGDLGRLTLLDEGKTDRTAADLSSLVQSAYDQYKERLSVLTYQLEISSGITYEADAAAFTAALHELFENQVKFGRSCASCRLFTEGNRILLIFANDTALPSGQYDQVFDRFTRLSNAEGIDGAGLGLAQVCGVIRSHNGRIEAYAENGIFTVRISL